MMEQKYLDLMNQELDGTNSANRSRELAEYLENNPNERGYFQELHDALQIFQKVDLLEPPSGLLDSIMAAVEAKDHAAPPSLNTAGGRQPAWRDFFRPARAMSFATGALFGLILFAGLFQFGAPNDHPESDWIQGTATGFLGTADLSSLPGSAIDLPGVTGRVRILDRPTGTLLHLTLQAEDQVHLRVDSGPGLTLEGYHTGPSSTYSLSSTEHATELTHTGTGDYYFLYRGAPEPDSVIQIHVQGKGDRQTLLTIPIDP